MNPMLSSILIVFKQLNVNSNILCKNSILVNNNQQLYCQKSNSMNNVKVQDNVYMTQKQKNIQLFIQNNITQQSVIDVRVYDMEVNTFALFGLNTFSQIVRDSIVSITIDFKVVVGALICLKCDVEVFNTTLLFIGSGMQISGVIIQALDSFRLQQTFIQFRLSSFNSSGLVNVLIQSLTNFSIVDCQLAGSNIQQGPHNGYITSRVEANQTLNISIFKVCVDATHRFGNTSAIIDIIGGDSVECEICGGLKVVYGICLEDLQHGQLIIGALRCVDPFQFVGSECVCAYGYLLNGSACVNILNAIQNMSSNIDNQQLQQIEDEISELANQISVLNLSIHNSSNTFNTSQIEQYILGNYTQEDLHLHQNTKVLDQRIYNNISNVNGNMSTINNNISTIYGNITDLKQIISTLNDIIQQQNDVIIEFNCSKIPGYQMINGTCTQVNCTISGQQVIQGRCRCTDVNSYVSGTSCVCPFGSTLFSGVCICNNTYAYISGSSCVCPTYSSPVGNVCTCPANSQIVGTKCVCNQIQGQMMLNTATPSCSCPANSVPDNGVCVCNVIVGQTLSNGACRCPIGKYVVGTSCETIDIIDYNDSSILCSQSIYISTFDISTVTKTVSVYNYTNGYVFNSSVSVNNSFININNNVYEAVVLPLFQNQSQFINLKIQLENQLLVGGHLLTGSGKIIINQMKIISRENSTLSANSGHFSILTSTSNNVSVSNLMLNLSFTLSWGNISLVNQITSVLIITNYQILGDYRTQNCIAMIGNTVYSAILNISNVNFKPNTYIMGNYSSYIISKLSYSKLVITNITIFIGDEQNIQTLNQISSNVTAPYTFGGLVTNSLNCSINVLSVISVCYQSYKTYYINGSGVLVGSGYLAVNNISLRNICLQQQISGIVQQYSSFGIVGSVEGNISIQQLSVVFIVLGGTFNYFGIVGEIDITALHHIFSSVELINITTTMNSIVLNNVSTNSVGSLIGYNHAKWCLIQNSIINSSNLSSYQYVGGIIGRQNGYLSDSNEQFIIILQNTVVSFSNLTVINRYVGGIFGYQYSSQVLISNITVNSINVQGIINCCGIFNGFKTGPYQIDTSQSIGLNYINGILQTNCQNYISSVSISGC
ncbi:Conserved_hypothetical protein [Hexamita inflata]|uniref:Uncharacterized protein n=1 Tax=Hexamita inflata TaxID=28002 RepID=A0AA86V758_9EUKA|nr:Conserved hypothetical protein [Hexamita inflata]CAI9978930.1 Conserved hypothetical protein [Hexamita inflata]CAI9978932.1 Conserved hypothetical protein [Hexamita inflata]